MKQVRLLRIAEEDIAETAEHYEAQAPGLGSLFVDHFLLAAGQVAEFPESAALVRGPTAVS